jgi:hypothetical protein
VYVFTVAAKYNLARNGGGGGMDFMYEAFLSYRVVFKMFRKLSWWKKNKHPSNIFIVFLLLFFFLFRVRINVNEYEMSYQLPYPTFKFRKIDFRLGFCGGSSNTVGLEYKQA